MEGAIVISSHSIKYLATPQYSFRSSFLRLTCHVSSCIMQGSRQNTSRRIEQLTALLTNYILHGLTFFPFILLRVNTSRRSLVTFLCDHQSIISVSLCRFFFPAHSKPTDTRTCLASCILRTYCSSHTHTHTQKVLIYFIPLFIFSKLNSTQKEETQILILYKRNT